jgi:cobyrinic acid a,c-diamide synthase
MNRTAFIIAAAGSGSGKTTLTLGLVAAMVKRGLDVRCFKCGPDFIDPTLHRMVTGKISYNLDLKMMGVDCCRETFAEKSAGADVVIVEGVMGLFDGGEASSGALARALGLPVVLVVDTRSMAQSAAAVLNGFLTFDPDLDFAGVIFNRIGSPRHRQLVDEGLKKLPTIAYCGYFNRDKRYTIAERHLGLHMGEENPLGTAGLDSLAEAVEAQLDLDLLATSARFESNRLSAGTPKERKDPVGRSARKLRLGVALDDAFCFYYPQNFEMFEARGFEIVPFSPLSDSEVPADIDMLYFGGGYPENHAARLTANHRMRSHILSHHQRQIPIYAECGGFMYLCRSLSDMEGCDFEMVGIFPLKTAMNKRLRSLGYRQATLQRDCLLGNRGDTLHGHEFHYSEVVSQSSAEKRFDSLYLLDNNTHEGYIVGAALGSYVHLHFGGTGSAIDHIYNQLS